MGLPGSRPLQPLLRKLNADSRQPFMSLAWTFGLLDVWTFRRSRTNAPGASQRLGTFGGVNPASPSLADPLWPGTNSRDEKCRAGRKEEGRAALALPGRTVPRETTYAGA